MADPVVSAERRKTMAAISGGMLFFAGLWFVLLKFLPPPQGASPLQTAFACSALAALFALVPGVEAIAHERLVTRAIDPLAGVETPRLRVNFHYLSNTLEQYVVYVAGLFALSITASPRLLVIITLTWVAARWAFWIGYHVSPLLRGLGAPGMAQSMIVLLYVAYHWGTNAYGPTIGALLIALFFGIEIFLFWAVKRPSQ